MGANRHDDELAALAETLRRASPGEGAPTAPPAAAPGLDLHELESALRDLRDLIATRAKETEEIVGGHPWAAVGAAFLLGLAVGRLTSRG